MHKLIQKRPQTIECWYFLVSKIGLGPWKVWFLEPSGNLYQKYQKNMLNWRQQICENRVFVWYSCKKSEKSTSESIIPFGPILQLNLVPKLDAKSLQSHPRAVQGATRNPLWQLRARIRLKVRFATFQVVGQGCPSHTKQVPWGSSGGKSIPKSMKNPP